jgi:thymidylate synthase ThyX
MTITETIVGLDDLDDHYAAEVLADSTASGHRLTTFKLRYPRFIHSEMMTHRILSRNAASSRAIPTERLIEQVRKDPFVPATFNQRVKGMGVGDEMDAKDAALGKHIWLNAADAAAKHADSFVDLGLDKSRANRILEPFLWYTAIFTGTEWDNFLALRDHEGAQPEIQAITRCIKKGFDLSNPQELYDGQWHLPLVRKDELEHLCDRRQQGPPENVAGWVDYYKMISASRCARVSFDRTDDETHEKTLERARILMGNGHLSPFEHVARPWTDREWNLDDEVPASNFTGWLQMRKEIPNESRFDLLELEANG